MEVHRVTLPALFTRTDDWTGRLERLLRDVVVASGLALSVRDLERLYAVPEALVRLVQAGVVEGLEIRVGTPVLRVDFSSRPDAYGSRAPRILDIPSPKGKPLEINLIVTDHGMAGSLGILDLVALSSQRLRVSDSHIHRPGSEDRSQTRSRGS